MDCPRETLLHFAIRDGIFLGRTNCQIFCSEPARQRRSLETWATQGWIWAFLWLPHFCRAKEALKEGLWLLFPTRQGVGIATHTGSRKGWCGGTELLQDLTECNAETGHPVLCFALLWPLLSTRVPREMKWRSYLSRGATEIDAQSSQFV